MNIQTIPRKDKVVKAAFVPKLDAFLLADYPSIEMKVLAFYLDSVGHPSMAEMYRAGRDLYRESVAAMFGKDADDLVDEERQVGKVLNLSTVYGGGPNTVSEQLGVSFSEAFGYVSAYHEQWPGIGWERGKPGSRKYVPATPGTLVDGIKVQVAHRAAQTHDGRGYIETLYGRQLRPKAMHAAVNNLCQGCAADLMKWAMERVDDGLKAGGFRSHLVNMVHDELMFDCVEEELPTLHKLVPEWMTDPRIEAVVPIRPECELSYTTWADKLPYEEVFRG